MQIFCTVARNLPPVDLITFIITILFLYNSTEVILKGMMDMRHLWWKYLFLDIVGLLHFLTKIVSLFMIGHQHSIKLYIQPHFMFVKFSLKANLYLLEKKLWWRKIVFANIHQFLDLNEFHWISTNEFHWRKFAFCPKVQWMTV